MIDIVDLWLQIPNHVELAERVLIGRAGIEDYWPSLIYTQAIPIATCGVVCMR